MSLTTEQKINLLILAGFDPYLLAVDARIMNPAGECLYRIMGHWHFETKWGYSGYCVVGEWDKVSIDTCPDELIYEAIGATK